MQCDLNNPLAVKYNDIAVKSFERVSDIIDIEVIQCITPDTLLPHLKSLPNALKQRSPQELASLHSNYRMMNRIAAGERFWILEHDAYLRPQHEDVFRMIMSKWLTLRSTINLGTANEFYTTIPEIARLYCNQIEADFERGPMSILHKVTDDWQKENKSRNTYWPANRYRNVEWTNMTGVSTNCSSAYNKPPILLNSPVTQICDIKKGSTVTDRPGIPESYYSKEKHPDFVWVNLDTGEIID